MFAHCMFHVASKSGGGNRATTYSMLHVALKSSGGNRAPTFPFDCFLHIALILLLSARRSATPIHAHCDDKYFLKFTFDRTFVVSLSDGSVMHKYMHCSGEYALLFRSVREDIKVDVNPPVEQMIPLEGKHWKLEVKHDLDLVLAKYYPVGQVVKVRAVADAVRLQMMLDDASITAQQKVKSG